MGLQSYVEYLASIITVGIILIIDLNVVTTNALDDTLLSQHPD